MKRITWSVDGVVRMRRFASFHERVATVTVLAAAFALSGCSTMRSADTPPNPFPGCDTDANCNQPVTLTFNGIALDALTLKDLQSVGFVSAFRPCKVLFAFTKTTVTKKARLVTWSLPSVPASKGIKVVFPEDGIVIQDDTHNKDARTHQDFINGRSVNGGSQYQWQASYPGSKTPLTYAIKLVVSAADQTFPFTCTQDPLIVNSLTVDE